MTNKKLWTSAEFEKLHTLQAEGWTQQQIGQMLGRTVSSIRHAICRSKKRATTTKPQHSQSGSELHQRVERLQQAVEPVIGQVVQQQPPSDDFDAEAAWSAMARRTQRQIERAQSRRNMSVRFDAGRPIGIVALSDQHIGGKFTDMNRLIQDAQLIRDTPHFYAVLAGDSIDNHVKHRAAMIEADSTPDEQYRLFEYYLQILTPQKVLCLISGNHDGWSHLMAGVDMIKRLADLNKICYAPDEARLSVQVGAQSYHVAMRHKYRFNSSYNQTHSVKQWFRFGPSPFDIGIVGHHHEHSLESAMLHGQQRYLCRPGSYQILTGYSAENGFNDAIPTCPTFILHGGNRKRITAFDDLREAVWAVSEK